MPEMESEHMNYPQNAFSEGSVNDFFGLVTFSSGGVLFYELPRCQKYHKSTIYDTGTKNSFF